MAGMAGMADVAIAVDFVDRFSSTNGVNGLMHTATGGFFIPISMVSTDPYQGIKFNRLIYGLMGGGFTLGESTKPHNFTQ